ncbi:unnamed protein product [Mytilus coruscus]|uniref:Uncharacterized protein n=1 Tax=Mytilus coruscus TaxID=42192 RepID=A0A6J8C527_MYTCO|nr:unnamed protein product [Mytilus coruscus]
MAQYGRLRTDKVMYQSPSTGGYQQYIFYKRFLPGVSYCEELKNRITKVDKVLIVLSKTSSRSSKFLKVIDCTLEYIDTKQLVCNIIPLLLDDDVDMPFMLHCYIPFLLYAEDSLKLIRSLCVISEEQRVGIFVRSTISSFVEASQLRRLNILSLPPSASDRIKKSADNVMQHWGVTINEKCLTVNMNTLQNLSAYHRFCLNDLYRHFHAADDLRIIRATGVTKFRFQSLFKNGQVYEDLISIYTGILAGSKKTNNVVIGTNIAEMK